MVNIFHKPQPGLPGSSSSNQISRLSFVKLLPTIFSRDIPTLTAKQNKQLKTELALLGNQFSWANFIVVTCSVVMIYFFAVLFNSNIRFEVWIILQGTTIILSLLVFSFNAYLHKKNKFTYFNFLIGQLAIACFGAMAWGSANYVLSPDIGNLAELAMPLLTAAPVVVAIWLAPVPLAALLWQILASVTFLLLGNFKGDFIPWYALSPLWSFLCMILCFSLFLFIVRKILSQIELQEIQSLNEQLLGEFEQHSSDFIWKSDAVGRLVFASRVLLDLSEREDVNDRPFIWDLFSIDEPQQQHLESKFSSITAFNSVRVSIGKHPKKQWFALTGSPNILSENKHTEFKGFGSDISEAVELERTKQASHTSEAISQMACTLAHDFNNYLAVVSSSLEIIEITNTPENNKISKVCKFSRSAVDQATELSRNLLSIGKNDLLHPTAVDYVTELNSVKDELNTIYGSDINVLLNTNTKSFIFVDKGQLHRALRNLMENAALSMDGVGVINVTSQMVQLGGEKKFKIPNDLLKKIQHLAPGSYCRITITDSGVGFPEEMLDSEIQMFRTTRRKSGGTGIGLAMVNGFCQQSGGVFNIYNSSTGAVTELILPAVFAKNIIVKEPGHLVENDSSFLIDKNVLIIEDDKELSGTLSENLLAKEMIVDIALSLKEAKEKLTELSNVDFIVSDMMLPDGHGAEIYPFATTKFPDMKFVFMTGYVDESYSKYTDIPGPMLLKPFSISALIVALVQQ